MTVRQKDTLLLVGDADSCRVSLRDIFQNEYDLLEAENLSQVRMLPEQDLCCAAAVVADVPLADAGQLCALTAGHGRAAEGIPVLLVVESGDNGRQEERAFALGAADVIVRSYTPTGILRRVQNTVQAYRGIRDGKERQQMETALERYRSIMDQSGDIVFVWDLTTDEMQISAKWEDRFGYTPVTKQFSRYIAKANQFHPDDLPRMREKVAALRVGAGRANMEVRIINREGEYVWSRIWAESQTDEQGRVAYIIGVISNIDRLKRTTLELKEQAEQDALTKLLNKDSARRSITDYLERREPSSLAAMIILDLDNFKAVNDNCGHLYGDAVLAKVGEKLRKLFRYHDVIGRIGGDEFLVLMRDVPGLDMVHARCQRMLSTFRELLGTMMPDLNVSCSIGVAMAPQHGNTYAELFQHADEALYLAKSKGKNQYRIYDPKETLGVLSGGGSAATRIDSDERPGMANDSFVRYVFRRLYQSRDIERTIDDLLAHIGQQLNVSRVYIFENNPDNTACDNTFEWCNQGISPEKDSLQNVSYITDIPGWKEVFDERGVFYCEDISRLDERFRIILEPQGIKSMLQCAIMDEGVFRGYVGFDECTINRMWTKEQIELLDFLAEVLALFLLKKRSEEKVAEQAESLRSLLDRQDAWIYVLDPRDYSLKFFNKKARRLNPESQVGMTCHQVFMGRDCRCEGCPAACLTQEEHGLAVLENLNFGLRVRARASRIIWNGEPAYLMVCYNLDEE